MRALDQFITGHGHFATEYEHIDYCSYHHHHHHQYQSMWNTAYLKN